MIASTAIICMALTIYHEARGEMIPGQYAVAQVLWNRADANRQQVCKEAFAPKQFSWANRGVSREGQGWRLAPRHVPKDQHAWWVAQRIAKMVMQGVPDFTRGAANHYHAVYVQPTWRTSMVKTHRIGRHIFYRA